MNAMGLVHLGVTYFARDPLHSYVHEQQKNEIYFLNNVIYNAMTQNNWFIMGSHKYDVYLFEEKKAHVN